MKVITNILASGLLILGHSVHASSDQESKLYEDIAKKDYALFEQGFNKCELSVFESLLHKEFEFYHDENGVQQQPEFIKGFKDNICSDPKKKPIRKLIKSSMEVFPMKSNGVLYGAVQRGVHEFYIQEQGKAMYKTNIAKFTHYWQLENDDFKLKHVLSFDHKEPPRYLSTIDMDGKFDAKFPETLFDRENKIKELLKLHKIPTLSIGYINEGKLQQIRTFGNKNLHSSPSMNGIYKVASLTKPVVALIALKLIEDGLLELDEPIAKYHVDPDVANDERLKLLTTRYILSHQSGFTNWRYLNKHNKLKFEFTPGKSYQYSGEGFEYLRKAIEAKLARPLEDIADEYLFTPLGMNDTHFYWSKSVDEKRYLQESDESGKPIPFEKHTTANAAANLLTTTEDYSKFMVYLLQGADLSTRLYKEMLTKQVSVKEGVDFGLGWQIFNNLGDQESISNEYALSHTGGDYGTKTIAVLLPKSNRGLVVLSNSENAMTIWSKIISEYFGPIGDEFLRKNFL